MERSKNSKNEPSELALPTLVFGTVEVHRLQRELEALEEFMQQAALRSKQQAKAQPELPRVSRLLDALASENQRNLLQAQDRKDLAAFLQRVADQAPTIHMSFATDPSAAFTAKIVSWLRANIHPLVMLQLGLQPSIAAGCIVRTPNRQFDLSLRHRFEAKREVLMNALDGQPLKGAKQ